MDLNEANLSLALTQYGSLTGGDFQQYAVEPADLTAKVICYIILHPVHLVYQIPDDIPFDAASTIPLGLTTASLGLIGLFPPCEDGGRGKYAREPIFVGGASFVGQFARRVQPIITTASVKQTQTLKRLGATYVRDRNLAEDALVTEVQKISTKPIEVAYSISSRQTQKFSYKILASGGALLIDNYPEVENVVVDKRLAHVLANANLPATRELSASLPNSVEILPNGLNGVADGLKKLETSVSNVKLVARPQDTV
ncbi:hypothetical protein C8Q72DRAFT_857227 [Fomitopsis betulina]|nr:hypothetical protein C8Q72DRAFT_857227 [Fomitopsis betulina]